MNDVNFVIAVDFVIFSSNYRCLHWRTLYIQYIYMSLQLVAHRYTDRVTERDWTEGIDIARDRGDGGRDKHE